MCYADFAEIVDAVARMDIDVISLEAARSGMALLRSIDAQSYDRAVGPGVYDVHRPACPSVGEIVHHIAPALETFGPEQLWVNPDCGLKTRSWNEVRAALANMVDAAPVVRPGLVGGVESGNSENARHATRTGTAA